MSMKVKKFAKMFHNTVQKVDCGVAELRPELLRVLKFARKWVSAAFLGIIVVK